MTVMEISHQQAVDFLLPRHYSGRVPNIKYAFGWFDGFTLCAVLTVGKPASNFLCSGVCGKENSSHVYELNRLCKEENVTTPPLSQFVAKCLKMLKKENLIIVSYSDTAMNHHGYIYQACNFMYTGATKERTDLITDDGKHPRHYTQEAKFNQYRKVRSSKHRYVYFCTNDAKLKRKWKQDLRYELLPYPKGDNNKNYTLGFVLRDEYVPVSN